MRHPNKKQAIEAARTECLLGKFGGQHVVDWTEGITYTAEPDGVYRHERNCDGGVKGIKVPDRRVWKLRGKEPQQ